MSFLLIFILSLSLVRSKDICFLKPNGIYEGMTYYKHYSSYNSFKYMSDNKNGFEYELELNVEESKVQLKKDTKSVTNSQILHRIGFHYTLSSDTPIEFCFNCWTDKSVITDLECLGIVRSEPNMMYNITTKSSIASISGNSILFHPYTTGVINAHIIAILNPKTGETKYTKHQNGSLTEKDSCNECDDHLFVKELSHSISKLESIVDFNLGNDTSSQGFLLFFNIEGQPKYCYQTNDRDSSYCSKNENLKKLEDICLPEPTTDGFIWIIISLVLVILVVLIIVGLSIVICMNTKNSKQGKTQKDVPKKVDTKMSKLGSKVVPKESSKESVKTIRSDLD